MTPPAHWRPLGRVLASLSLSSAMAYACSGSDPGGTDGASSGDAGPPGYADVIYEGAITDEALLFLMSALEQHPPDEDASHAPVLQSPPDTLSRSAVPTLTWSIGSAAGSPPPRMLQRWAEHDFGAVPPRRRAWPELLGLEGVAEAHGTPYTGQGTWAVFSAPSNPALARVLTSKTSYTPSEAVWDRIAAGGTVTLTLIGASFVLNRVVPDGGPYQGSVTTFTVD